MIAEHRMAGRQARERGSRSRDDHPMIEDRSGAEIIVRRASLRDEVLYIVCKEPCSPNDFDRIMTQKKRVTHTCPPRKIDRGRRSDSPTTKGRRPARFAVIARCETDDGAATAMRNASGSPARSAIRQR
ncbi:hypothetical protein [Methylosinus sp. KRF6]|uniref:hypothetical protein n=1 Tax=Methylosinus sp. KRF6 TaxID=2846853 RepID=UPI001C0C7F41|nr:hypothetical protein [Methylosinus sp. KRF6]MBU3888762.1 hypothetical protein [Methylosinus sp. KRF6]